MKKNIIFVLVVCLTLLCGCSVDVITMPYGSEEYEDGDWTPDTLAEHFEELGFSNLEIVYLDYMFGTEDSAIYSVLIEDTSSKSLFTEYKAFDKGDEYGTWLKIRIEAPTPTLTIENCDLLEDLVKMNEPSSENEHIQTFMEAHDGEYIEFDGTIINWYDEYFWVGVDLSVSVEDSEGLIFSWDTIDLIELKLEDEYHHTEYSRGKITDGMRVHMVVQVESSDKLQYTIKQMEIID